MSKNRLQNLNDHLFAQIERLCDEDLTREEIETESRRSIALVGLADQTIRNAMVQIHAAQIIHDHDGRDPTSMLQRFVDVTPSATGRTLAVVRK